MSRLEKELAEATKVAAEPFSFVETATKAYTAGADAADYVLHTSAGERLVKLGGPFLQKADVLARSIVSKVTSANYTEYIEVTKTSDAYLTHVAPRVEKATTVMKPHWDQYGRPALEQGARAYESFQQRVLPSVKTVTIKGLDIVKGLPQMMQGVSVHLDPVIVRIFDAIGRIVPRALIGSVPNGNIDRLIFLFLFGFFGFHFLLALWKLVRLTLFLTRIAWVLFRFCVLLPLMIIRRVFAFVVCVGTGCYCCGLCRRRKSAKDLATKAGMHSNGTSGTDGASASKGVAILATVAEVQRLLELAKKEKRLEAAAKQLASMVKSGKVMSAPKNMAGKTITKDAVVKAVANFKELDVKKLNL